jgi:hypothetical protein
LIGLALIVGTGAGVSAQQKRPLPAFSVVDSGGQAVASTAIPYDATWLLVYVQPRCAACDRVLKRIDADERAAATRIVVVAGGMDAAGVAELAATYPHMQESRWLADPDRSAARALGIRATPIVLGMRGGGMEWRLNGVADGGRELDSILFTWLEKR